MKRLIVQIGMVCFITTIAMALLIVLASDRPPKLKPNQVCYRHSGVQRVYLDGRLVRGVVCRDGYWQRWGDE